jgi:hypothetical protein
MLPIWMDIMKHVLEKEPQGDYPVPDGIVFRRPLRHVKDPAAAELLEAGSGRSTEQDFRVSARMHGQTDWAQQYGGISLSEHQARVRDRREQKKVETNR